MKLMASIFAMTALSSVVYANDIRIVGSSTVFPFASAVAEQFHNKTGMSATIESTGSGGGFKLFCSGVGLDSPPITNASRRIKEKEVTLCVENGVSNVTEYKIGYDDIVFMNSADGPTMHLTKEDIFNALNAKVKVGDKIVDNPYTTWKEVNPEFPDMLIAVMGPPPSSGTRDAFEELVMEGIAEELGVEVELREDGAYIEAGENDNIIIEKLAKDTHLFGIAGYSYLDQNANVVKGAWVDAVEPTYDNIADGLYPVSRSLWFYTKNDHIGTVSGIDEYVSEFTNEDTWGPDGYLSDMGLISLPDSVRFAPEFETSNGFFVK